MCARVKCLGAKLGVEWVCKVAIPKPDTGNLDGEDAGSDDCGEYETTV